MSRKWSDLTVAERDHLLYLSDTQQLDGVFSTLDLNMGLPSLRAKLSDHRTYRKLYLQEAASSAALPPSPSRQWLDFEILTGDDFIIISDVEIPDHSLAYLQRALLVAMQHGIKKLIIAGDAIKTDQTSLTDWALLWKTGDETLYEGDIALLNQVLAAFATWFDEIIVIEGNHDDRVARKTGGEVHLGMLIRNDKVKYSRYHYLWIQSSRGWLYVCHPRQYSANSAALGQKIYNKLVAPDGSKPIMVFVAHTHQAQTAVSSDGLCEIVALGTCRDKERTQYMAVAANTYPTWENGFAMLKSAYAYPLTSRSDWRFWLGDLYERIEQ